MAGSYEMPDHAPVVDDKGMASLSWLQLFSRWHRVVTSLQQYGPTADRPTKGLWIGRQYFDTDLGANGGMPVWVAQVTPAVVWVDAAGNAV